MPDEKQVKLITVATAYGIVVSLLYLFGYWSSFRVNILEYIQWGDILKLSLYPLCISVAGTILGMIISPVILFTEAVKTGDTTKVLLNVKPTHYRIVTWSVIAITIVYIIIVPYYIRL